MYMDKVPNNNDMGELIYPSEKPEDVARGNRINTFNNLVGWAMGRDETNNLTIVKLIELEISGAEPTWQLVSKLTGLDVEKLQEIAAKIPGFKLEELNTTNTDEFKRFQKFCQDVGLE